MAAGRPDADLGSESAQVLDPGVGELPCGKRIDDITPVGVNHQANVRPTEIASLGPKRVTATLVLARLPCCGVIRIREIFSGLQVFRFWNKGKRRESPKESLGAHAEPVGRRPEFLVASRHGVAVLNYSRRRPDGISGHRHGGRDRIASCLHSLVVIHRATVGHEVV